jgi:hypothetical protein
LLIHEKELIASISPEPSPEPYRPLGPVESNVYELIPLAEELRATRFVSKVKNPVVTSFFPRNKLDEFSVAVQRGGMAIDRAINILTRPHDLETDKKTLARIIMHLRAALVASKVLSALQQELRLSPDTFLSDEDRTKLEDFIEALRARPPFRGENYLDRDQELVQLVATLREEVKKRQNNKEPKSQPEQTPTPQPVEQCRDTPVTIRRYHSQENGRQIQYKRVIK